MPVPMQRPRAVLSEQHVPMLRRLLRTVVPEAPVSKRQGLVSGRDQQSLSQPLVLSQVYTCGQGGLSYRA